MQVTNISDFDVRIFHLWRSNRNRTDINFFSTGSMDSFEKKQFQFLDFHLDSVHHMGFEVFTRATRGVVCSAVTSTRKLLSVLISVLEGCNDARRVGSVSPSCFFPGQEGSEISSFEWFHFGSGFVGMYLVLLLWGYQHLGMVNPERWKKLCLPKDRVEKPSKCTDDTSVCLSVSRFNMQTC